MIRILHGRGDPARLRLEQMAGKRAEGFLIGFLLAGSIAGVLFVFFVLREGDTGFGDPRRPAVESAERPAKRPLPREEVGRGEGKDEPPPAPAAIVPKPEPVEVEQEEEPPPRPPGRADGRAELTLELIRPVELEDRRVLVTVTDVEGVAIAGALVVVRLGTAIVYRDRTDADGIVAFHPHEEETGPFRIDALADYFAPGSAPDVKPGADISLPLQVQPWIEGRVDAPTTGHGVVTLYTERGQRRMAIADDGSFLFEGVDPGWVTVQAEVDPYGADSQQFLVQAGTTRFVRLKVRPKNRVEIFGDIEPWEGVGKAWMNNVPLPVSVKGRYRFKNGVFGLNEIIVDAPGKALFQKRFTVEGRKAHKFDFRIENDASIAGWVAAADTRERLVSAEVRVGIDFDHPLNKEQGLFPIHLVPVVYTDEKGRFEVKRLKAGMQYTISVVKHPYAQFLGEFPAKGLGQNRILLPAGPFLYGKLRGLGGIPNGAKVTAYRLLAEPDRRQFNVPKWDHVSSGRDDKGFYGLGGLIPDVYVVRAEAPGYGATETVVDLREPGRERMDLRIRKGDFQTTSDIELLKRLPPVIETADEFGAGSRSGVTVLTIDLRRRENEIPLPGVFVRFFEGDLEFTAPMLFDEQEFDLIRLPEATYRAVLTHPLLDKPIVKGGIRLRRGEPYTLVFRE